MLPQVAVHHPFEPAHALQAFMLLLLAQNTEDHSIVGPTHAASAWMSTRALWTLPGSSACVDTRSAGKEPGNWSSVLSGWSRMPTASAPTPVAAVHALTRCKASCSPMQDMQPALSLLQCHRLLLLAAGRATCQSCALCARPLQTRPADAAACAGVQHQRCRTAGAAAWTQTCQGCWRAQTWQSTCRQACRCVTGVSW